MSGWLKSTAGKLINFLHRTGGRNSKTASPGKPIGPRDTDSFSIGIHFEALEPRILLSGSGEGAVADSALQATQSSLQDAIEAEPFTVHEQTLRLTAESLTTSEVHEAPAGQSGQTSDASGSDALQPNASATDLDLQKPFAVSVGTNSSNQLFANDLPADSVDTPTAIDGLQQEMSEKETSHELVIVDSYAHSYQQLVDDLLANSDNSREIDVFVLDADRDGLEQIKELLGEYENLDALHLVSHGTEGAVKLGDTWLDNENLADYSEDIAAWKNSLSESADILFYGCELAASESGRAMLNTLGSLTGAAVAASEDSTGHVRHGGDWDLEYSTGAIETPIAFSSTVQQNWDALLAPVEDDFSSGDYLGGSNWSGPWQETGDTNNRIEVVDRGSGDWQLMVRGDGSVKNYWISRQVDLSGSTSATLSYDYDLPNQWSATFTVDIRDGNTGWTNIRTYDDHGGPKSGQEIDIPIASNLRDNGLTEIRFRSDNWADPEYFYIDNIQIIHDGTGGNTAPTAADSSVTTDEGATYTFAATDFQFSDADGDSLQQVQITSLETAGSLQLNGIDVTLDQVISRADIDANNLTFTPVLDANGTPYSSFGFRVHDGTEYSASSYNMTVNVTAVNDEPVNSVPVTQNTPQNTSLVFNTGNGNLISVDDVDAGSGLVEVALTATDGTLSITGAAGDPIPVTATGSQQEFGAKIARAADGSSVMVWASDGQDGNSWGIYAQRYDSAGSPVGSPFQVNTESSKAQESPAVAMDNAGNFVVVWQSLDQDTSGYGIYGQRYSSTGATVGTEFHISTETNLEQSSPVVAMDANGNFVVVWQSLAQDTSGFGIYGQRYDNTGATQGLEFQINTITLNDQKDPSVAMADSGEFVVSWTGRDAQGEGIYARLYDAGGTAGAAEFLVNSHTGNDQKSPKAAMDADGDLVITWQSKDQDGDSWGVYAQRYNSSGTAQGGEIAVNTETTTDQQAPDVAMSSSGTFVIAWESMAQDGDSWGVYKQEFDASGTKVGVETRVNTGISGAQYGPSIGMTGSGDYLIVWNGESPQDNDGVSAQRFLSNSGITFSNGDGSDDTTMTFSGTVAEVNDALNGLTFKPTSGFIGTATLRIVTNDQGNTGSGGALSDDDTIDITVYDSGVPLIDLDDDNSSGQAGFNFETTFTEDAGPVFIVDGDAAITDPGPVTPSLESLTVRITNLLDGADEVLAADITGTSITAAYNSMLGRLFLSGTDSLANYEKVLRTITYNNTSHYPDTTPRIITFVASDGTANSDTATTTLNMVGINDTPAIAGTVTNPTAIESGTGTNPVALIQAGTGGATDVDAPNFDGGTITVTLDAYRPGDRLSVLGSPTGVGSVSGGDETDLVISLDAGATPTALGAILEALRYENTGDDPTTGGSDTDRTYSISLNDGGNTPSPALTSNTLTGTISIAAENDDPWNAGGLPPTLQVNKDVATNIDLSAFVLGDVDAGNGTLRLTLSTGGGGSLSAAAGAGLTISGNNTDTVTIDGALADLNAYLFNSTDIQYLNDPGTTMDTITVSINDNGHTGSGGGATINLGTVNVYVVNNVPVAEANGPYSVDEDMTMALVGTGTDAQGDSLTYEWDLDYDGAGFDVDATGSNPTFDATGLEGPDMRTVALRARDDSSSLTLTSGNTWAATSGMTAEGFSEVWFARGRNFSNGGDFELGIGTEPGGIPSWDDQAQITWTGTDSFDLSYAAGVATFSVGGTPVQSTYAGPFTDIYIQVKAIGSGNAITVDNMVLDLGSGDELNGAAGSISASSSGAIDMEFIGIHNLSGLLSDGFGLKGTVTSSYSSGTADSLTFDIILANDPNFAPKGGAVSAIDTATVTINGLNDAPAIVGTATNPTATESGTGTNQVALIQAGSGGATDVDASNFDGGTITVTLDAYRPGDRLSVLGSPTGVGSVSGGDGAALVVTLNSEATPANLGVILEAIRFENTGDDPTVGGSDTDRVYNIVLNDGGNSPAPALNSNSLIGTITLIDENDAPVANNGTVNVGEDATIIGASVPSPIDAEGDLDPNGYALVSGVGAGNGSLTFNSDGTFDFDPGSDFQDLTVGDWQVVTFTYTASDTNGGTSTPGTVSIIVIGVNDAPVANNGSISTNEDTAITGTNVPAPTDIESDLDPNGYALVTGVGAGNGSLTFNSDGTYDFDPTGDFDALTSSDSRDVTFTYTASDTNGGTSAAATITITVDGVNDAPTITAVTGPANVDEDAVYSLDLSFSDPDDSAVTWTVNWGDGQITSAASTGATTTLTHTYTQPGFTYNILASANDGEDTTLQNELLVPTYAGGPDSIFRYEETTGAFLQEFAAATGLNDAVQVVVGPDGNIYVTGEASGNVLRYSAVTWAFIDEFIPTGRGGLNAAGGLDFGPDGNLYVSSYSTDEVLRYNGASGAFIDSFVTAASGGLDQPYGLTFGPDGNLYVASYNNNQVLRYDGATGGFIDVFVSSGSGLSTPEQMIFGPDGHLYIASFGTNEVLRYNGGTGAFIDVFVAAGPPGGLNRPTGLAFGPDGNLYVSDFNDGVILRYNGTTGAFMDEYVSAAGNGGLAGPAWLSFLPEQQVLVNPVNDPPVNSVPGLQNTLENTALEFSTANGNLISFSDPDSGVNPVEVTLTVTNGTLTLDGLAAASGGEFNVSPPAGGAQEFSSLAARQTVAMDADGDIVTVWQSDDGVGNGLGVFAQRFDAAGLPQGSVFRVNTTVAEDQQRPIVAMDNDGNFVVVWESYLQDGSQWGVYAQRFDATGTALGGEIQVNTTTTDYQRRPTVAMDDAGNFVVIWADGDGALSNWDIYGQRFDASGNKLGTEFRVNTTLTDGQLRPTAAMDRTGNFIVTWQSRGQDSDDYAVIAQRYNADGTPDGGEFRVNTSQTNKQWRPTLAMAESGEFVIAWESENQDGDGWGIYAQRFDASGAAQGTEFRVNSTVLNDQQTPSVAMDADGDFVITWQSDQVVADGWGIYSQRYNADGTPVGFETLISTTAAGAQENASVVMDDGGGFLVVWSGNGVGDPEGVHGQLFTRLQNVSFTSGNGTDDAAMVFTGSLADINAALDGMIFTPDLDFNGIATVTITVNDLGNTGSGIPLSDTDTVNIQIDAVNNAPVMGTPSAPLDATEQTDLSIHGLGFSVSDVDELGLGAVATLSVGEGALTITPGDSGVTVTGGNGTGTVTLSGTMAQIDNLLTGAGTGTIIYLNSSDTPGASTTLTVTVNDQGNLGADPGRTGTATSEEGIGSVVINVTPVNDDSYNAGSLPGPLQVYQDVDTPIDLSSIDLADVDAGGGDLTLTISTGGGGVLRTVNGGGVSISGRGTDTLTVTGTLAELNAFLDDPTRVRYENDRGTTADTVSVAIDDNGNTGSGGGATISLGTVNVNVVATNRFYLTTSGDVGSPSGAPGLDSWDDADIIQFGDTNLQLGSNTTGRFNYIVGWSGPVDIKALHVVSQDITIGSSNTIDLQEGDILMTFDQHITVSGTNNLFVEDTDVFVYRDDGGAGTYILLLEDVAVGQVHSLTLVEEDTVVGDTVLQAGDFLFSDAASGSANQVKLFRPDGVGPTTSGTTSLLIDGDDVGLSSRIVGVDVVENEAIMGGVTLQSGNLVLSLAANGTAGTNNEPMTRHDIVALQVTATNLVAASAQATASMLMDGSDVGLNTNPENIDGLSLLIPQPVTNQDPNAGNDAYNVDEGATLTVTAPGVLGNDPDANGDPLSAWLLTSPTNAASFTLNKDGSFTYIHDGSETTSDSFTYLVHDGLGGTDRAVVNITINPVNDPAVIGGDISGAVTEDTTLTDSGTLTITDAEAGEDVFVAQTTAASTNGYGTVDLDATGNWTYSLNNALAAIQALDSGQTLGDSFTAVSADGTTQVVTITITGSEDGPVIGGVATGAVAEDGTLTATGTLTITDVDTNDNPISFNDVVPTAATYGSFEMSSNVWTYMLDNAAAQVLDAGQSVTDTYTFNASDGISSQVVTVTITGSEDGPVIGGVATGAVAEDGTLTITDVDTNDNPIAFNDVVPTAATYGSFEMSSNVWTYSLDNAAVQALDAGETVTDTYTFNASDGVSSQVVTVTITGSEDGPVIGGVATGAVAEDGTLTATGTLTITDVDTNDNPIAFNDVVPTAATYGSFEMSSNTWTYTLDNAAVQSLDAGQTVTDTYTFNASDGISSQVVTITITGSEDGPVIGGVATGAVAEDGTLTATGTLTITDVDTNDNPIAFNDVAPTVATYGSFEMSSNTWTYSLDNAAVQALDAGETVTDTYTFNASDGVSSQVVTITITGSEDGPVIGGVATGAVAEDGTLTATGTLTITDVDTNDNPIAFNDVAPTVATYGSFEMSSNTWTYTLDNAAAQVLDAGQTVTDTYTFNASDGVSSQLVTVTITGSEDGPVIGGVATGAVAEDGTLTATGTLTITDVDTNDNPIAFNDVVPTAATYGSFEMSSNVWTYTLDNAAAQVLDAGQTVTDTYTFNASDGISSQVVTVTITGSEDGPVIGGVATGAVAEDGTLTATGTLTITDVDTNDNPIAFNDVAPTVATYGSFEMSSNTWIYTLDNAAVQSLDAGQTVTDTYTFNASDGISSQVVTITITGSEDGPVIGGVATGAVAEDGTLTATGTLTITDVDTNDNPIAFNDVVPTVATYGSFEMSSNTWTYTLDNAAAQVLDAGQTVTDTYTFNASDGVSSQLVTVTITGSEDGPVIGGVATGAVAEDGTLTITDVDTNDNPIAFNDVVPTAATYGSFEMSSNVWTYSLDNAAVQALDAGETVTDTYTFNASDGVSSQLVTVTITGSEDGPVIGGVATGAVAEDGTLTATGTLTITDVDTNDNPISFNDVAPTVATYGSFEMSSNVWTYTLDNAAAQVLDAGQSVTDTYTFNASDGVSSQVVTITITGSEDGPVIGGVATGAVAEDGTLTATGTLTITEVDTNDNPIAFNDVVPTVATYGSFEMSSNTWTYTLDNAAVQSLDAGQSVTDTYTFNASDGVSSQLVTVTITGSEDGPVIGGVATGAVTEDGTLTATGTLTITDVDTNDNPIAFNDVVPTVATYGSFEMSSNVWTYTLDNAAAQVLDAGQTVTDTYTFNASDGVSSQVVTISITGSEDGPVIGGVATGAVAEDGTLTATGTLTITDVDTNDNPISFNDVAPTVATYGSFEMSSNVWTYTLDNAAVQALDVGQIVTDTYTFSASDGSSQVVTITITGTNDAPVITSAATASILENTTAVTTVTATDADGDTPTFAITGGADAGLFSINSNTGVLTFNAAPDFENPGDADTDNVYAVQVTANDGNGGNTVQAISVTVNDGPEPPAASNLNTPETYTEDVALNLTDMIVSDVDSATITVTMTLSDPTVGSLSTGTSGSVTSTFAGGVWTASGNIADVNALLASVAFNPTADYNGDFTITVSVDDGVTTPISGVKNITGTPVPDPVTPPPDPDPIDDPPPEEDPTDPPPEEDPVDEPPPEEAPLDEGGTGDGTAVADSGPASQGGAQQSPVARAFGSSNSSESNLKLAGFAGMDLDTVVEYILGRELASPEPSDIVQAVDQFFNQRGFDPLSALEYEFLMNSLDEMKQDAASEVQFQNIVASSAIAVTSGLSVGYVIWLIRSGILLSSFLSSMPAWQVLDPLPVLAGKRDDDDDDDESLESILKKGTQNPEKNDKIAHAASGSAKVMG